jgi:rhamnosyl/mannosyltransferase
VVRAATWLQAFFTPISPGFRGHLSDLIDEFKPDVIHAHLPNPSVCWWLTLRKAREIPLVIHWHSDVITSTQGFLMRVLYGLYRPLERRLLKASAAIVATSPSYLRSSQSLQEFPGKCHVVPLGLDPRRIEQFARQADSAEETAGAPRRSANFQILGIGRLTYYKGFGYLIRALAELPGVELHIVGEGSLRRELRLLAKQMKVVKRVHFHGGLDDQQLAARLEACDCLCLPSIERTEAFGLVLLEAKIFAKATVVSDVRGSGMAWVVEDGVTGVTVPPKDVPALVQALAKLRDNPELTRTLGLNGRARFDERFTIARSVAALAAVYQGVLSRQAQL